MVGMLTARELTLPLMINTGRATVVSTLIFELQSNGETGPSSAVALYMIVALGIFVFVARRVVRRNLVYAA